MRSRQKGRWNISNNTNDGIDNSEHILDMHRQVDMLIENILANTDNAFNILKLHEEDADQDIVDVYRIICNDILDCEKLAKGKCRFQNGNGTKTV